MGALGNALMRGASAAATAGGDALMKDYEGQQQLGRQKDLASWQGEIQAKLEAQRQLWQSGENDKSLAQQKYATDTSAQVTREGHTIQKSQIESNERVHTADREAAMERTRLQEQGANARAGMANQIARETHLLAQQKFELEKANSLPADIKQEVTLLMSQAAGYGKQITDLKPEEDPDGRKAAELRKLASEAVQQARTMLGQHRGDTSLHGGETRGAKPSDRRGPPILPPGTPGAAGGASKPAAAARGPINPLQGVETQYGDPWGDLRQVPGALGVAAYQKPETSIWSNQ